MVDENAQLVFAITILASIALGLTVISLVLFYLFRSQRVFPASLLGWISVGNLLGAIVTLYVNGSEGGLSSFSGAVGGSPTCRVLYAADTIVVSWSVCVNTFLALTLYLSVQKGISLATADNPVYLKAFIISAFLFVVGFALICGSFPQSPGPTCDTGRLYPIIYWATIGLLLIFQLTLLGLAFQRMKAIITSIRKETSRKADRRLLLLMVRFVPTIFSQFVQVVPNIVVAFIPGNSPVYSDVVFVCLSISAILDGLILIVTNRQLWKFARVNFLGTDGSSSGTETETNNHSNRGTSRISSVSVHVTASAASQG